MKQTIKAIYTIILAALLAACGIATPVPTVVATATSTPSLVPASSTPVIPPATLTPVPTSPIPVSFAPDGLRMAYSIDGNLYFQDGSKPPVQLTQGQERNQGYRRPISFSEDGDRIFYFQGGSQDLYSIHIDGTQEQALLTTSLLLTLDPEYDEATTLCDPIPMPHTNFVLVRTCTHPDVNTIISQDDLLLVDMDTNKVETLLPRGKGGSSYTPSPDGSMLAFEKDGHIHILGINGRMIYRNLATYKLSEPYAVAALIYWLPDSSGVILALPISMVYDLGPPPTYEVWRYSLKTGTGTQIDFDPPVMGHSPVWVSPDGNWITYTNQDERLSYLGDLQDGHTQSYGSAILSEWSPDSVHFLYNSFDPGKPGLYLASIHEPPMLVFGRGEFVHWLDASRYIYFTFANNDAPAYVLGGIGEGPIPILTGNIWTLRQYANIIFYYQP